ncbi:SAVMC3_10250 family protein [Streptomyces chartreusis]|uniref:SAVMC3_10250 family protein n=1 Tax=Streptomyces chartreusis TaxID=1969 RepID=UPI0035DEACF3
MQELVYLSDAKLRQFVPERRRRTRIGRRLTNFRLDASTPAGGGGLEVGLAEGGNEPSSVDRLADVIKYVEEHALWYEDPQARAGRWVYFEAPFNTVIAGDTVLLLDTPAARADEREQDGLSLLLHGSASHLLIDAPAASINPHHAGVNRSALIHILHDLRRVPLPGVEQMDAEPASVSPHPYAIHKILCASNRSPGSAAWMRGYARVTLRVPPRHADFAEPHAALVATPLYVEYAHDLPY